MLIRDIDRKLDRRLVIKFKGKSEFFSIFEKYEGYAPAYGYRQNDEAFLDVFIPKTKGGPVSTLLKSFSVANKGEYSVIRAKTGRGDSGVRIFSELHEVPSMIRSGLYVQGGYLHTELRFHHSYAGKVSDLIGEITKESDWLSLHSLGPSPGIVSMLDEINSHLPLFVIGYEGVTPPNPVTEQIRGERITEPNLSFVTPEGYSVVSYSDGPLPDGANKSVISKEDGIVAGFGSTPFALDVWRKSGDAHIPRFAVFGKVSAGKFVAYTFIPRLMANEQLRIIYEVSEKHPDSGFKLTMFTPYDKGLWDVL